MKKVKRSKSILNFDDTQQYIPIFDIFCQNLPSFLIRFKTTSYRQRECFQNFGGLSKNKIFSENLPPLLAHLHAALTFEPLWGQKNQLAVNYLVKQVHTHESLDLF